MPAPTIVLLAVEPYLVRSALQVALHDDPRFRIEVASPGEPVVDAARRTGATIAVVSDDSRVPGTAVVRLVGDECQVFIQDECHEWAGSGVTAFAELLAGRRLPNRG